MVSKYLSAGIGLVYKPATIGASYKAHHDDNGINNGKVYLMSTTTSSSSNSTSSRVKAIKRSVLSSWRPILITLLMIKLALAIVFILFLITSCAGGGGGGNGNDVDPSSSSSSATSAEYNSQRISIIKSDYDSLAEKLFMTTTTTNTTGDVYTTGDTHTVTNTTTNTGISSTTANTIDRQTVSNPNPTTTSTTTTASTTTPTTTITTSAVTTAPPVSSTHLLITVVILNASVPQMDRTMFSSRADAYVVLQVLEGTRLRWLGQSPPAYNTRNPRWNHAIVHEARVARDSLLEFELFDRDKYNADEPIGKVYVHMANVLAAGPLGNGRATSSEFSSGRLWYAISWREAPAPPTSR